MKIAVLGSGGRLGMALARAYAGQNEILAFDHAALDLASAEQISTVLDPLDFDVLVNCAALTNVDWCETHEPEAMRVNAEAPRQLAEICARKRARCVHVSTDYVFDGTKTTPYLEEDEARPISIYGQSKRQGEIEMLAVSSQNLVVRVSWVFGPDRPSFIDAILNRALNSEKVEAIANKFSTPTFTLDFAALLKPFLQRDSIGGLLHACNAGECSWREYGQFAIDCAVFVGLPIKARTVDSLALDQMVNFSARRPVYTVLDTQKITRLAGSRPRPWKEAVEDYVTNYFTPASC